MDNVNNMSQVSVVVASLDKPVMAVVSKPLFRDKSAGAYIMEAAMAIKGDFNHKDLVQAAKALQAQRGLDFGNIDRNARYVVVVLAKNGKINKVRRGRWIVVN